MKKKKKLFVLKSEEKKILVDFLNSFDLHHGRFQILSKFDRAVVVVVVVVSCCCFVILAREWTPAELARLSDKENKKRGREREREKNR